MHAVAADLPAVAAWIISIITALLGGIIGWILRGERETLDKAEQAEEVELFITTTPDAYAVGKTLADGVRDGQQLWYRVTRHQELGAFTDINGERHHQWRILGRPA